MNLVNDIDKEYARWLDNVPKESDVFAELKQMNAKEKEDAFYKDLSFGTGGLRGIMGAGTSRMNEYTVAKASQGLANYLKKNYNEPSVCIGYDSRKKSDVFADITAKVMSANGVKVYKWNRLLPVPTVSFAVRSLKASAGVMITASHNPGVYNGYKVYKHDGSQITSDVASLILEEIEKIDIFRDVKMAENTDGIFFVPENVYTDYIENIKKQSVLYGEKIDRNLHIVYSPLNGTGLEPVTDVLRETGYTNVFVVSEQEKPDGNFPTCPYPNPEVKEALHLCTEYAKKENADLFIATDPDCDRTSVGVKKSQGEYEVLTGNEMGLLLLDYICNRRFAHHTLPQNPLAIKTIVTTDLANKIAEKYHVTIQNVLTGFKYIGEQIGKLEQKGMEDSFVFGFEDSYGYLTGSYVRDKDGVDGTFLICEMYSYYKTHGIRLLDKLDEIYQTYGYVLDSLHSYEFDGSKGVEKIDQIMQALRKNIEQIGNKKVIQVLDYEKGIDDLPNANVIKFVLEENTSIVIRPSGTEPKIKLYFSICAKNKEEAKKLETILVKDMEKIGDIA